MEATIPAGNHVRFLFDPICPWTWRTSLWVRAVARLRPLTIEWGLLSLLYINRNQKENPHLGLQVKSRHALRLLARAREIAGNRGIDRLYLELGDAYHNRGRELDNEKMLEEALARAELPASLVTETRDNRQIDKALENGYEQACAEGAFGVPTLYFDHSKVPYFGPVIDRVPSDQEAA